MTKFSPEQENEFKNSKIKIAKDPQQTSGELICYYPTKLNFLQEHNGFRPGYIHLFLGTSGSGKSTLVRTLIKDILENSLELDNIFCWLSEESGKEFSYQLNKAVIKNKFNNLMVKSEMDYDNAYIAREEFQKGIKLFQPKLMIFDNITTSSFFYDGKKPDEQAIFASYLKRLAIKLNIPILIFAHTGSNIFDNYSKIINQNDIRGSRTIVNIAPYIYILQRFNIESAFYSTIRIDKNRLKAIENSFFGLTFEYSNDIFSKDFPINFEKFKEIFNKRNKL